jgi:hypothetical protein
MRSRLVAAVVGLFITSSAVGGSVLVVAPSVGASNNHGSSWFVVSLNGNGTYPSCNEVNNHSQYWSAWAETRSDPYVGNCAWARAMLYVFFTETHDTGYKSGNAYIASPTGGSNADNSGARVCSHTNYCMSSTWFYHT